MDDYDHRPKTPVEWLELGEAIEEQSIDRALTLYWRAWHELPRPKGKQQLAAQILSAIADCEFQKGNYDECQRTLKQAFEECRLPEDSPFARLRLGQCQYELGNTTQAETWLLSLYKEHGREPFEGEDPKYLEFVTQAPAEEHVKG